MKALKYINLGAGLVLIALLIFAGSQLRGLLEPDAANVIAWQTDKGCDLATQTCRAVLADKSMSLMLAQPIRYLEKIDAELTITGLSAQDIDAVWLDFSMQGMEMGFNRFGLRQTADSDAPLWQGQAMLPVCVTGRKDWQVKLVVETAGASHSALFKLTVNP